MGGIRVGQLFAELKLDRSKFDSALDSSGGKFSKFGKLIAVGAAAAAAAIAAIGAASFAMTASYDEAVDRIRVGTGAIGADLAALEESFSRVAKRVPESLGVVGQVIADLSTRTGQTGKSLEDLAVNILDFSRLTKTDVNTNVRNATRVFGDWSIATEHQAETLDKVFRASQATGLSVDSLMQTVVDFGAPMRLLGFSFEQGAALLAKWEKEGVNTETMLTGLKFGVKTLAREGIGAADMGEALAQKIKAIGESVDPVTLAIETFGLRAGPDMAAAILEGRFAIDDLVDTMVNGVDSVAQATKDTRSFGEVFGIVMNTLATTVGAALLPAFSAMEEWFQDNLPAIQAIAENVGAGMVSVFEGISGAASTLGAILGPIFATIGDALATMFGKEAQGAMSGFQEFADNTGASAGILAGVFVWISDNVVPPFLAAFDLAQLAAASLGELFNWLAAEVLPPIIAVLTDVAEAVLPAITAALKWAEENWETIFTALKILIIGVIIPAFVAWAVAAGIAAVATIAALLPVLIPIAALGAAIFVLAGLWNKHGEEILTTVRMIGAIIGAVFRGIGNTIAAVWSGVVNTVKGAINNVIGIINAFIRFVNSIQIHIPAIGFGPVKTPAFDWWGLRLPQIPYLAKGIQGFGGGLAVVGERGPELVSLPRGSNVYPNGIGPGGMTVNGPLVNIENFDGSDRDIDEVSRKLARQIRLRTGFVSP